MTFNSMRITIAMAALTLPACLTGTASAQCCGGAPTTAFYQPAAYTAYSPVAVQTVNTGWYPGYFLDRIRTRLFGSPSTYVAAYPSTYVASYPSTYVASYPSSYMASYAPTYTSSYSMGYATSYAAPCTSCAPVQQVTMRPVCATACSPVCPCDPCSAGAVSQAGYQESVGCPSCSVASQGALQQGTYGPQQGTYGPQQGTYGSQQGSYGMPPASGSGQPELAPESQVPQERIQNRPTTENNQQPIQPAPGNDNGAEDELEKVLEGDDQDSSTYFEAPKLFNPKDRTALRSTGAVRTALYERPVTYRQVSSAARPVTAEQAKRDAAGWVSASN